MPSLSLNMQTMQPSPPKQFMQESSQYLEGLYDDKPRHRSFGLNLKAVFELNNIDLVNLPEGPLSSWKYIVLTQQEWEELSGFFEGEKIGGSFKHIIWIHEDVPEKYREYVLLNLVVSKMIDIQDEQIKPLAESLGASPDSSKAEVSHWTSLVIDMVFAQKYLSVPASMKYMKWREQYERTRFFELAAADKIKRSIQNSYTNWKLFTQPKDRHWRTKRSFALSLTVNSHDLRRFLGQAGYINKVDSIFVTWNDIFKDQYDPIAMIELLELIHNWYRQDKKTGQYLELEDPRLDQQAYLLTEHALNENKVLICPNQAKHNCYKLKAYAGKTISALLDRVKQFAIQSLLKITQSEKTFCVLSDPSLQYDLANPDSIYKVIRSLQDHIQEIEAILEIHQQLVQRIKDHSLPPELIANTDSLNTSLLKLQAEVDRLEGIPLVLSQIQSLNKRINDLTK